MRLIFGREPAVFWAMASNVVLGFLLLFAMAEPVRGAVNALVVAAAGLATAVSLNKVDAVLAGLEAVFRAGAALFLAFGTPLPENVQVGILALITTLGAFFVRQNVTAPVTEFGRRAPSAFALDIGDGTDR